VSALLELEGLDVHFPAGHPVRDLNLSLQAGETLGVVGESGSGKSLTALAIMGLLPRGARRSARRLVFDGMDLTAVSERRMADIRGRRLSMIFQDPMTSLNPAYTIGDQLTETYLRHFRATRRQARERAAESLDRVGIAGAARRLAQYPHQLSGGLRQRVMMAMALICEPALLIADEPTTALDVTIQAEILQLLLRLQSQSRMALMLITHDLGIVARLASRVLVVYAGQVVETGVTADLFAQPRHPYTQALLGCIPVPGRAPPGSPLFTIPGAVPAPGVSFEGCQFRNRCAYSHDACAPAPVPMRMRSLERGARCVLHEPVGPPALPAGAAIAEPRASAGSAALVELRSVTRTWEVGSALFGRRRLTAVDRVSLEISRGEVLGLVGESGCGKSTLAQLLLGLVPLSSGTISIGGTSLHALKRRDLARHLQPVFQDPFSSLNPQKSIGSIIGLPLRIHGIGSAQERDRQVREMMDRVGLSRRHAELPPAHLSGGQRQRVAIARALIMRPELVVCDEPTSALDVSVQAQILNLLLELRRELGLAYLLISHNLAVVEHLAGRVAVMYLGRIVEIGPAHAVLGQPAHPYTRALLASVLTPDPAASIPDPRLRGTMPNPLDLPPGCRFHPRCPHAMPICAVVDPADRITEAGVEVACHLYEPAPASPADGGGGSAWVGAAAQSAAR